MRDDDQLMQIEVNADEESFFQSEISEAEESENDQDSEIEFRSNDEDDSQAETSSQPEQSDDNQEELAKTPQEKVREIDQEVANKLHELQAMMIQGGLTESVKILTKCLNQTPMDSVPEAKKTKMKEGNNFNTSNATQIQPEIISGGLGQIDKNPFNPHTRPCASESTIYKNAVDKRVSSSSDEMDSSGEFIHALSFNHDLTDIADQNRMHSVVNKALPLRKETSEPQPSCSGYVPPNKQGNNRPEKVERREPQESPEDYAER